jgi:hypothetical protein
MQPQEEGQAMSHCCPAFGEGMFSQALVHELESHHIHVDTRGDSLNPHHLEDTHPALPEAGSSEEAERERESRLRAIEGLGDAEGNGEVGIFKISHLGKQCSGSLSFETTSLICDLYFR